MAELRTSVEVDVVASAWRSVEKAEAKVDELGNEVTIWTNKVMKWTNEVEELVNADPENPGVGIHFKERDSANERLKEANERLNEARAHHLQLLESVRGAAKNVHKPSTEELLVKQLKEMNPTAVHERLWKSVVKISSSTTRFEFSATALIVDKTDKNIYLLTNLHLWIGDYFDKLLSTSFKDDALELKERLDNKKKEKFAATKEKEEDDVPGLDLPNTLDQLEIRVEQLQGDVMKEAFTFKLNKKHCWESSASFEYAIFRIEVPVPEMQELSLSTALSSGAVYPTMNVYIVGFSSAAALTESQHAYTIIPARVTGMYWNRMILTTLSAPGIFETAIVCTGDGIFVGYVGKGGPESSVENELYQSFAITMQGLPRVMPSSVGGVELDMETN